METMEKLNMCIRPGRKNLLPLLVLFFLCWHPGYIGSESLTLTTYYPAPYGGYVSILTTGQTILARDGASTVAVGSISPTEKLHVSGNARTSGNVRADINLQAGNNVIWGTSKGRLSTDQGASMELGGAGTPYIDFSQSVVQDFSARIILSQAGRIQIVGDLEVTGDIINVCTRVGYGVGGVVSCPGGKRVVGFMGDGVARVTGFLPRTGTTSSVGTYIVLGEDWGGTMVCCKF